MSVDSDSIVYERRSAWSIDQTEESGQVVNDIIEEGRCSAYTTGTGSDDADGGILYMRPRRAFEWRRSPSEVVMGPTQEQERNPALSSPSSFFSIAHLSSRSQNRSQSHSRDRGAANTGSSKGAFERQRDDAGYLKDTETAVAVAAPLRRYGHRFFSKELAICRAAYLKILFRATLLVILLNWACLPIYWGSLSSTQNLTGNLRTWVINRDQARIGDALIAAVLDLPTSGPGALWWQIIDDSQFPDNESVMQAVVEEQTWLAIVVNDNATNALSAARVAGDDTYDPTSAITVYYAQARNEVATGTYLVPLVTAFLTNFTTSFATSSAQRYLAAVVADDGTVNTTALSGIARAPQTISPGISYDVVDLRPYTTPEAQAPLLVGQIYICIFAFIIVVAHHTARSLISEYLTLTSYLLLRLITPLVIFFPLSLCYSLVSLAFGLPFGASFSYGQGFVAFFGYVYLGMVAIGLALEAMITVLGIKCIPLFLVLFIVVNISTAALPPELQMKIYAYGSGFQFWNIQQATRTIFFNTYSHLGKNAGLLVAWVLISCATTALFTCAMRFREVRSWYKQSRNGSRNKGKQAAFDAEYGMSDANARVKEKAVSGNDINLDETKNAAHVSRPGSSSPAAATNALGRWQKIMINRPNKSSREDWRYKSDSEVEVQESAVVIDQDDNGKEDGDVEKNEKQKEPPDSLSVPDGVPLPPHI